MRDLFRALQPDEWRKSNDFSADIKKAHEVILDPFAREDEKIEALRLWLQRKPHQPCLFGRIAAATDRMHICVLSDEDLSSNDQVREKIKRERLLWKIGSLRNERPAHGFMLLVASRKVALAAPDQNLLRFAQHIRDLAWDETQRDDYGNDLTWETLYLQKPDKSYVRFTFSVDYFGSQGDGRWWHDHRVPGGIAFTANSVGHMAQTREWYEEKGSQTEWIVAVAMETVYEGADTPWGKSIWLENLREGKPERGAACPFRDASAIKAVLKEKDWSYYAGFLSTDHSIREEFFRQGPERPNEIKNKWLLDLLYLYDPSARDYAKFVSGETVSEMEIYEDLGPPDTWRMKPIQKVISAARQINRKALVPIAGSVSRSVRRMVGASTSTPRDRIFAALDWMRKNWQSPEETP